jgi:2-keto-3-deoxy-L-rhamnonate aldolase RhmA
MINLKRKHLRRIIKTIIQQGDIDMNGNCDCLEKFKSGKLQLGTHITCNDPQMTEMIGNVGFDYFWIDTEHTVIGNDTLLLHLIAARATNTPAFVRIPWNDPVLVKPVLELGVDGLIFPMIHDAQEAQEAIRACLYPPEGTRGYGPRRAIRYGLDSPKEYIESESKKILKLIQIETRGAVENIDEIAGLPGVDIVILGPNDLSGAYGKLGQIRDPEIQKLYRYVVERAHAADKPALVSYGAYTADLIQMWIDLGVDMITAGSDAYYVVNGAKDLLRSAKEIFASERR